MAASSNLPSESSPDYYRVLGYFLRPGYFFDYLPSDLRRRIHVTRKVSKIAPLNIKTRLEPSLSRANIKGGPCTVRDAVEEGVGVSVARRAKKD